ncbi:unnamed protein product, partial [Laminaria digitata]
GAPAELLTAAEAALRFKCAPSTLIDALKRGDLTHRRVGKGSYLFDPLEVDDWLREGAPS